MIPKVKELINSHPQVSTGVRRQKSISPFRNHPPSKKPPKRAPQGQQEDAAYQLKTSPSTTEARIAHGHKKRERWTCSVYTAVSSPQKYRLAGHSSPQREGRRRVNYQPHIRKWSTGTLPLGYQGAVHRQRPRGEQGRNRQKTTRQQGNHSARPTDRTP